MAKKNEKKPFWDKKINPITGFRTTIRQIDSGKSKEYRLKREKYLKSL